MYASTQNYAINARGILVGCVIIFMKTKISTFRDLITRATCKRNKPIDLGENWL